MMDFLAQIRKTMSRYGMLQKKDTVIAAVSGGPDSVALIHVLHDLGRPLKLSLVIAHLNHGLRGKESDRDARFVAGIAKKLGLTCEIEKTTIEKIPGESLQDTARKIRYTFLEKVAQKYDAREIATGHNADDQAETVLIRLLKGGGRKGLGGIPPVRKIGTMRIIRPLLGVSREDILEYLGGKRVRFVTDSSNRRTVYLRNRVRREILPLLKKVNPNLVAHLARVSCLFREEDLFLESLARQWWRRVGSVSRTGVRLNIASLFEAPGPLQARLVRQAVEKIAGSLRGLSLIHYEMIHDLALSDHPNQIIFLPKNLRAERRYASIILSRDDHDRKHLWDVPPFEALLRIPGTTRVEGTGMRVGARVMKAGIPLSRLAATPSTVAYLDMDKINPPLVLRSVRPGDRFQPLGMSGTKKVKDLFIEKKIPRSLRRHIAVLDSRDGILWVLGLRRAARARLTKTTKRVLRLEMVGQANIAPSAAA